jgi:hypothetical protein
MPFLRRCLIVPSLAVALFFAACTSFFAQNAPVEPGVGKGSLAGRITDLNSSPLAGVQVVLHNVATGAETRTTTTRNGSYRFAGLDAGEYTLAAESAQLGRGQLEGVMISAGHEARVQAAIDLEPETQRFRVLAESTGNLRLGETPAEQRTGELRTREPAPGVGILQTSTPIVSAAPHASMSAAEELAQPVASAPVQFAAVKSIPLDQSVIEVEALEPERPAESATPAPLPAVQTVPILPAPARSAHSTVETASLAAPTAFPVRPALSPAADLAPALSVSTSSVSGVQPMLSARPMQLLPVAAAIARVDPVIPVLATTVSDTEVAALPSAGRNWQNFALETPTASSSADSSQPVYRGEDQAPAEITIDGAPTRLAFGAAADTTPSNPDSGTHGGSGAIQGLGGQAWNGGRGFSVSEAGVREVETVAGNVEAEAARGTGGRIAVKTAHGEDQIHGQAFLFDRQNTWGAQNPFTQWIENTGTAAAPLFTAAPYTPPDHETTWGAGLGGHLRRDKLFWFAALDSYRRNDPGLSTVKLPIGTNSSGGCAGFFCMPSVPETELLSAQLNESFNQANNDYLGIANGSYTPAGLEQLQALLGPAPRSAAQWVGFGRIDWQTAERHRITLEGIGANWNSPGGGLTRLSENYGNHSYGSSEADEQWLLSRWEAYITPNLLTTTQGSAGRDILTAKPDAPSAFERTLLSGNVWGQLPQIVVDSRYGLTIGNPSRFGQGSYPDEKLYHAQELVDWVHNNLLFKAGLEVDHNADATSLLRNQSGTYYYSKVQNFIADALAFEKFGLTNLFNDQNPHNCNPPQNSLGALPCYSYYSQTIGPTNWNLSTSDFAGFATAQWQPEKQTVVSFGLRWEREKLPPPIAAVSNPQLPLTLKLPDLGNNWGPRISVAIGNSDSRLPVLRLGYGIYYGRTENATLETALTQTGSLKGDLNFFIRPTDGMNPLTYTSDAPPFPYVLQGPPASVVKPGAVGFAATFRNPEVHQAVASVEEALPSHIQMTAAALASLGRRLPISIDTNIDHPTSTQTITYGVVDGTGAGPIKASQVTVPFYASWPGSQANCPWYTPASTLLPGRPCPDYQQITQVMSRANSTYEAAMIKIARYGRRGLSLHAHYTYSHAMDWNPNETTLVAGSDVLDPADFSQEYGVSDLDVRHSAAAMAIYQIPWKTRGFVGMLGNGWMLSSIGQFRSGMPYTMRTSGSLPELVDQTTGAVIAGLGPGMNGSGGDNRVYGVGRNTYRYPRTWKADLRLAKRFDLGHMRDLELMAESFNLFNHQNVTELETTGYYLEPGSESSFPTLNFLTGLKANTTAFGQPLSINGSDLLRERQIQFGLRMRF